MNRLVIDRLVPGGSSAGFGINSSNPSPAPEFLLIPVFLSIEKPFFRGLLQKLSNFFYNNIDSGSAGSALSGLHAQVFFYILFF